MTAVARATDPSTSYEAAASIDVTRLEGVILDMLKRYSAPGATTFELAEALGIEVISVSPRMKPLQEKGLVRDTGFRARGVSGRLQIIWRVA
jgi:predicted ArsR family transcriptional regulator